MDEFEARLRQAVEAASDEVERRAASLELAVYVARQPGREEDAAHLLRALIAEAAAGGESIVELRGRLEMMVLAERMNDIPTARAELEAALRIRFPEGWADGPKGALLAAVLTMRRARYQKKAGDLDEARASGIVALQGWRELGMRAEEAWCLFELGRIEMSRQRPGDAKVNFEMAAELFNDIGDASRCLLSIEFIADSSRRTGDMDGARRVLEQALLKYRTFGDRRGEARVCNSLAELSRITDDMDGADSYLSQALRLHQTVGDAISEVTTFTGLGDLARLRSKYDQASEHFAAALGRAREIGSQPLEAKALEGLAAVARARGDHAAARADSVAALEIYRARGERFGEANALLRLGTVEHMNGNLDEATDFLRRSLEVAVDAGYDLGLLNANHALSRIDVQVGRYTTALSRLDQALAIAGDLRHVLGQAHVLATRGRIESETGADPRATIEDALRLYRFAQNRLGEGQCLRRLADAAVRRGDLDEAETHATAALDIAEDIGEGRGRAYALASAAGVVAAMGRLDEARSAYEEALQIHLAENDHEGAGNDLLGLGTVAEARGAIDDARAYFRDAVGRYEHISERPHIVRALTRLAAVAAEDEAMRAAAHAVAMIDAIKHDNVPGPLIDGFVEANRDAYRHAVRDGSR